MSQNLPWGRGWVRAPKSLGPLSWSTCQMVSLVLWSWPLLIVVTVLGCVVNSFVEEDSDFILCPSQMGFVILYLHRGTDVRSPSGQEPSGPAVPGSCCPTCPILPHMSHYCCPDPICMSASQGNTLKVAHTSRDFLGHRKEKSLAKHCSF